MKTMCSHGNDREGCPQCDADARLSSMDAIAKADHRRDLVAYQAMGLMLSMLDLGIMPISMLATANDLQARFAKVNRELEALKFQSGLPANSGSNATCRP